MNRNERRRQKKLATAGRTRRASPVVLRARNLESFRRFLPGLHEALASHEISAPAGSDDAPVSAAEVDEAGRWAEQRLTGYWNAPRRARACPPESRTLDRPASQFAERLSNRANDEGLTFSKNYTSQKSYFVVVLGIGLGLHLDELAEETDCQCLILADSGFDDFYRSTFVFDWGPLLERFSGNRRLDFVFTDAGEDISSFVKKTVQISNPCGLEGMHWFALRDEPLFDAAWDDFLQGNFANLLSRVGFFDDECYMLLHTYENLRGGNARVPAGAYDSAPCPAFVIGTGPSLDDSIGTIKANQEGAVIFACGSAIDPLFAHGIVPDFVIIIEQDPNLLQYHEYTQEDHDLSGVCLIGAANVYPGLLTYHDDAILFFRPGLSTRAVFADGSGPVLNTSDPVVANAAVSFARRAGFTDIYLFGVDLGAKDPTRHHSQASAYTTRGLTYPDVLDIPVKGNLADTFYTSNVLLLSKSILEFHIRTNAGQARYYNCSDGAAIAGTVNTDPATLSLPPHGNRREVARRIIEASPRYTRDAFDKAWRPGDLEQRIGEFGERIVSLARDHDILSPAFMTALMKLLDFDSDANAAAMVFRGTIYYCLTVLTYYDLRAASDEQRRQFGELAAREFTAIVEEMRGHMVKIVRGLEDGKGPEMVKQRLHKPVGAVPIIE